ncbi:hypothetical protein [Roseivivax marinus]|nr:hypothetical protein [Roseivivax marinus]
MLDPILRQTEALLKGDLDAAQRMRWVFRLSPWDAGRAPTPPRLTRAK